MFTSCASHTDNRSRVDLPSGNVNSERLSVLPAEQSQAQTNCPNNHKLNTRVVTY